MSRRRRDPKVDRNVQASLSRRSTVARRKVGIKAQKIRVITRWNYDAARSRALETCRAAGAESSRSRARASAAVWAASSMNGPPRPAARDLVARPGRPCVVGARGAGARRRRSRAVRASAEGRSPRRPSTSAWIVAASSRRMISVGASPSSSRRSSTARWLVHGSKAASGRSPRSIVSLAEVRGRRSTKMSRRRTVEASDSGRTGATEKARSRSPSATSCCRFRSLPASWSTSSDPWQLCGGCADQHGHEAHADALVDPDAETDDVLRVQTGDVGARRLDPRCDDAGVRQQHLTGRSQLHVSRAPVAVEEALTDQPLEGGDQAAHGGLRVPELACRAPERPLARNGFERCQMTRLDPEPALVDDLCRRAPQILRVLVHAGARARRRRPHVQLDDKTCTFGRTRARRLGIRKIGDLDRRGPWTRGPVT